jgi:hypothetical protein
MTTEGDRSLEVLSAEMAELRKLVEQTQKSTAELVEFWQAVQGGIKVLGWLGKFAKWFAGIAGACAAFWTAYHTFFKRM